MNKSSIPLEYSRYGPAIVKNQGSMNDCQQIKLLAFCREQFPKFSKRELKKCFVRGGCIFLNNIAIKAGHDEECRRLLIGDSVEIVIDVEAEVLEELSASDLLILYECDNFAIVLKPSGVSCAINKNFEMMLKLKLWNGKRRNTCHLLYNLEKCLSGLILVAASSTDLLMLRSGLCGNTICNSKVLQNDQQSVDSTESSNLFDPRYHLHESETPIFSLFYHCIISGKIGEVGENVILNTNYHLYSVLKCKVLQVSRCRSVEFISLIEIRIEFDRNEMGIDLGKRFSFISMVYKSLN